VLFSALRGTDLVYTQGLQMFTLTDALGMAPSAPMTTGTTMAFRSQSLSTSTFRSWYFWIFSCSFWSILPSPGIATSMRYVCHFFHHGDVENVVAQMLVRLDFKVPEYFNFIQFCRIFSACAPHLSVTVARTSCTGSSGRIAATLVVSLLVSVLSDLAARTDQVITQFLLCPRRVLHMLLLLVFVYLALDSVWSVAPDLVLP